MKIQHLESSQWISPKTTWGQKEGGKILTSDFNISLVSGSTSMISTSSAETWKTHTSAISPAHNNVRRCIDKRTTFLQLYIHISCAKFTHKTKSLKIYNSAICEAKWITLTALFSVSKAFNQTCCHSVCVHMGVGLLQLHERGLFCIKNTISANL